jgi:hypothetical protein
MKQLFVFFACFLFTSCIEVNEEIVINKNGSGSLSVNTDMGQMLEMLQSFMGADELAKGEFSQPRDTTILMKTVLDTATNMSAENKALLREGSMHLVMNMQQKKFSMNMNFPFKHIQDLPKIYENMGSGAEGMGNLFKGMEPANDNAAMPAPKMKQPASFYDIEASKGTVVRRLNKAKYALALDDSMMKQIKQMGEMGSAFGEMKMNTTLKLPKRVKKLTGSKAELSSDKKTVILKASFLQMLEHPEDFEFTVKY